VRVAILTKEWPPEIYGGAGVHVLQLAENLRPLVDLQVETFGSSREGARGHQVPDTLDEANATLQALGVDLSMAAAVANCDVVHSHTWYTNLGGHIGARLHDAAHVLTAHSLEPRRPWKAEQLGGGYRVSSWIEHATYDAADAVIAVSWGMRNDILNSYPHVDQTRVHVVHNGIDVDVFHPVESNEALVAAGVDLDRPYILFVGRITRQKGISLLLKAIDHLPRGVQLVLLAAAPDTPELGAEVASAVARLAAERPGDVVWVERAVSRPELIEFYTHATTFVCPSVYEPLGIVNLEAMACSTPVVASDVGGIPEVVEEGRTGMLVHYDEAREDDFVEQLAATLTEMVSDPERARLMGEAGRRRAAEKFSWESIARQTVAVYDEAIRARS
jgi:starch synthase